MLTFTIMVLVLAFRQHGQLGRVWEAFEVEMTRLYEAHDAAMEAAGLIPPEGEEDPASG